MRKFIAVILLLTVTVSAQESAVISGENYEQLQPVYQIDFSDYDAPFRSGWFALSADGTQIVGRDSENTVHIWENERLEQVIPFDADVVDIELDPQLFVLTSDLTGYTGHFEDENFTLPLSGMVLESWLDGDSRVWLEHFIEDDPFVSSIAPSDDAPELTTIPYAPAQDPAAVVRLGRIPPPYAVTSSAEGMVTLWHLETGEALAEVDNGTGEAAVFGAINFPPTHLIWRDTLSTGLYLLDLETGENRFIDELNGAYVQWFFLSPDARVILGVNLDFEPVVVAWDTVTGERTILGEYRPCGRPQPDMARLSADNTALVIGCDTGFEVWRVS